MRKTLLAICALALCLGADSGSLRFPPVNRNGSNAVDAASAWRVAERVKPQIDGQSIYSFKYLPDGQSVIIGTTDFFLFRVRLSDGAQLWKTPAKMMFQKEFDGPSVYDVAPDGRHFLSFGQTEPTVQASERFLVIRSCSDGSVVRAFAPEKSTFYSVRADKDHRYPGAAAAKEQLESRGAYWLMSIDSARFVDGGRRIVASYKNKMEGPNLYDRRLIIYEATGKKAADVQVIADKQTANWDQPAGFEIGHMQLPYAYNARKNSLVVATAHGRVHELDAAAMAQNQRTALAEAKNAGTVIFTALSTSDDMQTKDRQTSRGLALSPDGKTGFVSAGFEGGYIQLYAFDTATRREAFHSTLFDAGTLIAPSGDTLVVGGMFSGAKFLIVDTRAGKLVFVSEDQSEEYVHPSIFDVNPANREVAGLGSNGSLLLIRPRTGLMRW